MSIKGAFHSLRPSAKNHMISQSAATNTKANSMTATASAVAAVIRTPDASHFTKFADDNLKDDMQPNKKLRKAGEKELNTVVLTPSPNQSNDADLLRNALPDSSGFIPLEKTTSTGEVVRRVYKLHQKPNPKNENRLIPIAGDGILPLTGDLYRGYVEAYAQSESPSFRTFLNASLESDPLLQAISVYSTNLRERLTPTPKASSSSSSTATPPPPSSSSSSSSSSTSTTPPPGATPITPSRATSTPPPVTTPRAHTTPTPPSVTTPTPAERTTLTGHGAKRKFDFLPRALELKGRGINK